MGIATTDQWGFYEACLRAKEKRQAVQWIDGPEKTGSDGFGDEDLDVKPDEGESVRLKKSSAARGTGAGAEAAAGITRTQTGNTGGAAGPRGGDTGGTAKSREGDTTGGIGC